MMCPKCGSEDLFQVDPGIDTLKDDGVDVSPEETFVCIQYDCPNCGKINMFFDYDRTELDSSGDVIHENAKGGK